MIQRMTVTRGLALLATLTVITTGASPGLAASPSPSAGPTTAPTAPIASGANDLWFVAGDTLRRFDGRTGTLVAELDLAVAGCPQRAGRLQALRPSGDSVLVYSGANAEPCVVRVPMDGSPPTAITIHVPDPDLSLAQLTDAGGTIWFQGVTSNKDGTSDPAGSSLYRLDESTGELQLVAPRAAGLASTGGVIGVVHSAKKGNKARWIASTVDPATGTVTPIPGLKPIEPELYSGVQGAAGHLTFRPGFGGPLTLYDVATGTATSVPVPKDTNWIGYALPSVDGLLVDTIGESGVTRRFLPWGGEPVAVPDPCVDHPVDECSSFLVALVDGALWQFAGVNGESGDWDWRSATIYRYDTPDLTESGSLSGLALVAGPDATPTPAPTPVLTSTCTGGPADGSPTAGFCIEDLISQGSDATDRKAALAAAGGDFADGGCARPAGGTDEDRLLLCLDELGFSWRYQQRQARLGGRVTAEAFATLLPAYQWAAAALSEKEKATLDAGLRQLDAWPLDRVRPEPGPVEPLSVLRERPVGKADVGALRALLLETWLDTGLPPIPDPVKQTRDRGPQPDLPMGLFGPGSVAGSIEDGSRRPSGRVPVTSQVSKCELAVKMAKKQQLRSSMRSSTCGVAASGVWLLYLATGDERYLQVAQGIRDLELTAAGLRGKDAAASKKADPFFATLECWLDADRRDGCPSGL